jgi:hypothetical protein
MIFDETKRILTIKKIFHLDIVEKHISDHILTQLIKLLPDLITLKLHSLSLDEERESDDKNCSTDRSMKTGSKITKVYFEQMYDIKQFNYIWSLCPRMIHFKVKCINYMDMNLFLRTILNKINDSDNYYLRSLCFHLPQTNDQMIKNLEEIIKHQKLLLHFTIRCLFDNIYLQWK